MPTWTPRTPPTTSWWTRTAPTTSWNANRTPAFLLKEDGFRLLLESGWSIILEESEYNDTQWTARTVPS